MKILLPIGILSVLVLGFFFSCSKKSNPSPPVIDTIYATRPDSTVNLTKGLLVYLPFSGNIADSSGNNNPTQAIGNVLTYDEHGYANNAFGCSNFNGNAVVVTNNGSIKFDTAWSLSFAFMVNTISASRRQMFIAYVDPATGYGPSLLASCSVPGLSNFDAVAADTAAHCDISGDNRPNNLTDTTAWTPVPGSWYKTIIIYHKGAMQIYINGALIGSKTGTGHQALLCPNSKLVIGSWWANDPVGMDGKLDNIRLYNRVLTPHEITLLSSNYQVTSNSVMPALKSN